MFQEANAQTCAFSSPFNQTRDVRYHKAFFAVHAHHAKAWHQGGKRIVGNFWLCGGNGADKGGFTGVRQAQHADVRQQHQLQLQIAFFARRPHRLLTRRTVNGRFKTGVAQAVPAALRHHQLLLMPRQVTQRFAGALIDHARADRHFNHDIFAAFAGTVAALTVLSTLGAERFLETIVDQRVEVFVSQQVDITAVAAVTAVRAAFRDIFFTTEADATITAITCDNQNCRFINKLHLPSP